MPAADSIPTKHAYSLRKAAEAATVSEGYIRLEIGRGNIREYHLGDGRKVVDIRQVLKLYPRER